MQIAYIISYILVIIGVFLIIYSSVLDSKSSKIKLKKNYKDHFAILIPARNESSVINDLLDSLEGKVNMEDVYIIVETKSDKTVHIAEKYQANIYLRQDYKDKQRKGYALDECLKDILSQNKHYDLYFIFDADNIVSNNYFEEMLKTYHEGYEIGTGYRNIKNNENVITTCSGLTFSLINNLINKIKMKNNKAIIISGTGFYIAGDLIEKWQGFPFHSLTEDYELSLYASKNKISTYYNENAEFFDEQPNNMETSIKQRTRWVKGFLESRIDYIKNIKQDYQKALGITPYLFIISGFILFFIISFIGIIKYVNIDNLLFKKCLFNFIVCPIIIYLILFILTYIMIMKEIEKFNISGKETIKALFFNPLFLLTYIHCLIKATVNDDIGWDKIEHHNVN